MSGCPAKNIRETVNRYEGDILKAVSAKDCMFFKNNLTVVKRMVFYFF